MTVTRRTTRHAKQAAVRAARARPSQAVPQPLHVQGAVRPHSHTPPHSDQPHCPSQTRPRCFFTAEFFRPPRLAPAQSSSTRSSSGGLLSSWSEPVHAPLHSARRSQRTHTATHPHTSIPARDAIRAANEGEFYYPATDLVLHEAEPTADAESSWRVGERGESCGQTCAKEGLECDATRMGAEAPTNGEALERLVGLFAWTRRHRSLRPLVPVCVAQCARTAGLQARASRARNPRLPTAVPAHLPSAPAQIGCATSMLRSVAASLPQQSTVTWHRTPNSAFACAPSRHAGCSWMPQAIRRCLRIRLA